MTVTAHFAARRSNLIVIEEPSVPIFEAGRQVGTTAGKRHHFNDHRCTVSGQKSIDFMRARIKAADGPEVWELDASDVPPTVNLLAELATAEIERVREILRAEQDGPNREPVVTTCQAILDRAGVAERGPGAQPRKARHEVVTS